MKNARDTGDRPTKWIRRIAKIWSAPLIVYALLMVAGTIWNLVTIGKADPYAVEGTPPTEALPPILMFLSILGLAVAWRWEKWGGTIALVFILAVLVVLLIQRPLTEDIDRLAIPYLLTLVVAIPGILFTICGWRSSRKPA